MQERRNSIANALELRLYCTNLSTHGTTSGNCCFHSWKWDATETNLQNWPCVIKPLSDGDIDLWVLKGIFLLECNLALFQHNSSPQMLNSVHPIAHTMSSPCPHVDVIKWKHFLPYWHFVTGEFPAQRPVMWSFDVFFNLCPNKRLSKQSWGWWFEMQSHPLWRHCNDRQLIAHPWGWDMGCHLWNQCSIYVPPLRSYLVLVPYSNWPCKNITDAWGKISFVHLLWVQCPANFLSILCSQIAKFMGQHGVHLGPVGPRLAPCWPHEPCYQGCLQFCGTPSHVISNNAAKWSLDPISSMVAVVILITGDMYAKTGAREGRIEEMIKFYNGWFFKINIVTSIPYLYSIPWYPK